MNTRSVVYITGIPGSGKTTLSNHLKNECGFTKVIRYGDRLHELAAMRHEGSLSYEQYKTLAQSGMLKGVSQDVAVVDEEVVSESNTVARTGGRIVIESHAINFGRHGLSCFPYSTKLLERISLTGIVVVQAPSAEIRQRLTKRDEATPPGESLIERAQFAQMSVAITYSIRKGIPLYCIENDGTADDLYKKFDDTVRKNL